MDKEKIREIVYIVFAVIASILAVKLFIWLLPIILMVLLASFIYGSIKKNKGSEENFSSKKETKKTKNIVIIDEESHDDK